MSKTPFQINRSFSRSTPNVSSRMKLSAPVEDFRTMHLMPLVTDLLSNDNATESEFLRPNSTRKPYPDVDTYLETHIRLLWADFIEPLRQTIGSFCKGREQVPPTDKPNQQIHFYKNVTFCENSFLSSSTVPDRPDNWRRYNIRFDSTPGFDWEKNKRLIHGALVCLWNAAHRLIILATVTQSDPEELEKGWLTVSIEDPPQYKQQDFTSVTYTMMECDIFYEPYRVVMEAYQQLKESSFPFKEHLLGWKRDPGVPTYLTTTKSCRHNYRIETVNRNVATIKDVLNLQCWPSADELGVNPIQRIALHAAMTRRLALIQGPPGTGKTFIGRKIISTLLANKSLWSDEGNYVQDNARLTAKFQSGKMDKFWQSYGELWRDNRCPIVVICLTNQALDQFMEGVLRTTTRLIRVGSQSQSAPLEAYTMTILKENIIQERKTYKESAFLYHKYRMNGAKKFIMDTVDDLQCLNKKLTNQRKAKPRDLVAESLILLKIRSLEQMYRRQIEEYNLIKTESEVALCRSVDVVGLTTTGAARRRDVLSLLKPKIVLVEEAAQVLEPHIVASLMPSCQHLIMIGDHLQLRPQCNVHKLAVKYKMDVSLFERLIQNGVPSVMLAVQHRMRPEVARLIVPSVYKQLENHPSVRLHPAVASVNRNVFFLDHRKAEEREEGGSSYYNSHEAAMALRLAQFFCQQGVQQDKISILVTYAAQLRTVTAHRRDHYKLRTVDGVHVTTVDNYQGEENDIIILSLVRNNSKKSVGFLRTPNRVCVALSRARHGLFILGNLPLLAASGSKLWNHVQNVLTLHGETGTHLPLRCDRHQQNVVKVSQPEDFPICGIVCSRQCGKVQECGHPCRQPCHNQCLHEALCQEVVAVQLPCGHTLRAACSISQTENTVKSECQNTVCLKRLSCGHRCPLKCAQPCSQAKCQVLVDLPNGSSNCGHFLKGPCHLRDQKEVTTSTTTTTKGETLTDCQERCMSVLRCGHQCTGQCGQCSLTGMHDVCQEPCRRTLLCGHPCPAKCGQVCPPCQKPCQKRCLHRTCTRSCGEKCPPCLNFCDWACPHGACQHECWQLCNRRPCEMPCPKKLLCGHPCPGYCGEVCPPRTACPTCFPAADESTDGSKILVYLRDCGHTVPSDQVDRLVNYELMIDQTLKIPSCPECGRQLRLCYGRYADKVRTFYAQLQNARSFVDRDDGLLLDELTKLLMKDSSENGDVSDAVVLLLKDKPVEEQWRIYQRMYFLCLSAVFQSRLKESYSLTTVGRQSMRVTLKKAWADELAGRYQAVQDRLLESSASFLSAECVNEALAQWCRLDLLRQCRTMESVERQKSTKSPSSCQQWLEKAVIILENGRHWSTQRENDVLVLLKSAGVFIDFHFVLPVDNPMKPAFLQRVGTCSDDWIRCAHCQSIYPSVRYKSCPSTDCVLSLENLVL